MGAISQDLSGFSHKARGVESEAEACLKRSVFNGVQLKTSALFSAFHLCRVLQQCVMFAEHLSTLH